MACRFCKIDSKKTKILRKGKYYYITLSNPRLVPGHLLVVPKRHVERPSELTKVERREIFDSIVALEEEILEKFSTGCDIRSNYRPFIKENQVKVNHLHFHLQPREFEDNLYQKVQKFEKDVWEGLPKNEEKKFI